MAANRGESRASPQARVDDNTIGRARTGLTEALAELRRLTQDPFFRAVERVLANPENVPTESDVGVDTVRELRQCSAEHQRVAIELEAAAGYCRLVEREINQRVDALLGCRAEEISATSRNNTDAPSADAGPCTGLPGWLRKTFHRGPARRTAAAMYVPLPRALPASADLNVAAVVPVPVADIAARTLGPLEVYVAGQRVPRWNSLKARAVFQYLLIHQDRPIRRDVLMTLQWPNHSHNSARNNLNVALYSLRSTLDGLGRSAQPILYSDGCYILNPELTWWIDRNEFLAALDDAWLARRSNRFEQVIDAYHKAIKLYRGPLFEDDVVGEWYLPEQRHLKELYVQALQHLAETHFELGKLPDAARFCQLAVTTDPCCEPIHRMLMRCYAAQHREQLVSRQYCICVAALHDELGVSPSAETIELYRQLT